MTGLLPGRYLSAGDEACNFLDAQTCRCRFILASRDADVALPHAHLFLRGATVGDVMAIGQCWQASVLWPCVAVALVLVAW